ncbi:MAG: hypothetical protein ACT4OG_08680 [Alphaproteobacteria bacterium]
MRFLALAAVFAVLAAQAHAGTTWRITKDHWSEADEKGFSEFVRAIGESDCNTTQSCVRGKSNPYHGTDPRGFDIDADCAKWPYFLRAYYAWKNQLPFTFVNGISGQGDQRFGGKNRATSRHDIIDRGGGINGPSTVKQVMATVFSGTFRTDATQKEGVHSDFYSPRLQPGTIRAGTVIYDVNGHVAIVYKVDEDGRIYYMDAHPDFSITRSVYGAQFGKPPARLGGGFKNWRPFKLAGARRGPGGALIGGRTVHANNDQIADYSLEQYFGTEPNPKNDEKKARYAYEGVQLGPFEYVRVAVSGGKATYNPVYELKATLRTLCNDLNDRALYVTQAIVENIHKKPHPSRLPDNIYETGNVEWEIYSTPSRDARIKSASAHFYKDLKQMIELWIARDPRIVYDGMDLKKDLEQAYTEFAPTCTVTYVNTQQRTVTLNFEDMMSRLFAMSFDPYHCIELRWGATGDELRTCADSASKRRWYEAEQRLRNQIERTYGVQMGFDVAALERAAPRSGVDTAPPVNIKELINSVGDRVAFQPMAPLGR